MDDRLVELRKLVTALEADSPTGSISTKEDLLRAAELIASFGRILEKEASTEGSTARKWWVRLIGVLLIELGKLLAY